MARAWRARCRKGGFALGEERDNIMGEGSLLFDGAKVHNLIIIVFFVFIFLKVIIKDQLLSAWVSRILVVMRES